MSIRTVTFSTFLISMATLSAVGCGSAEPGSAAGEGSAREQTQGTLLASLTTQSGHAFEFVELKAGDVLVNESVPTSDVPALGAESRAMSLADVYRELAPGQTVPRTLVDADARVEEARSHYVPTARPDAPEGPAPNREEPSRIQDQDNFYTFYCAPTNSVNCFEGRTGSLTGAWVADVWFQTAGMVDSRSPAGTSAVLDLNEWVSGVEQTVYSHSILPGNYWNLTRWTLPPTYHRGILVANSSATMTSFAEQTEDLLVNVPLYQQLESDWCWAATGQMVMAYFGLNVSQCAEANLHFNRTDCCTSPSSAACDQAGNPDFTTYGFTYSYTQWGTALPFNTIVSELAAGRPVTHQIEYPGHSHFVVVVGAYTQGPLEYVVINDPESTTMYNQLYGDYVSAGSAYSTGADQYAFHKN